MGFFYDYTHILNVHISSLLGINGTCTVLWVIFYDYTHIECTYFFLVRYKWLHKEDISQLPIPELIAPGGLVAVWVTNKRQLVQWTIQELLPKWGLEYIGEWLWIKVDS